MYIVYVLQSQMNKQLYVGFTENIGDRLRTHNNGHVISTKTNRPWKCIFHEWYISKMDALRREKYFKTTPGKRALKLMLHDTLHIEQPSKVLNNTSVRD